MLEKIVWNYMMLARQNEDPLLEVVRTGYQGIPIRLSHFWLDVLPLSRSASKLLRSILKCLRREEWRPAVMPQRAVDQGSAN